MTGPECAGSVQSALLARLQEGLPLVRRPFAAIGEEFGLEEGDVISFLEDLSREGKVRRFGGVFDARRLGCRTALAAAAVEEQDLDRVASLLTPLSGVTHCYRREISNFGSLAPNSGGLSPQKGSLAPFARSLAPQKGSLAPNLWFTVSYPADVFPAMVDAIRAKLAGAGYEMLLLPAIRRFKVDVIFSEETRSEEEKTEFSSNLANFSNYPEKTWGLSPEKGSLAPSAKGSLAPNSGGLSPEKGSLAPSFGGDCPQNWRPNAVEIRIGSVLQGDTEIRGDYWAGVAERAQVKEWELLSTVELWRRAGRLKRVGLLLSHRNAGWKANGMCCWLVDGDRTVEAGRALAAMPEVTHCYERPLAPSFGYNLFAMVHSRTVEGAHGTFERISRLAGLEGGTMLLSVSEYKKTSLRFFP